jgi:hypothetical protein
MTGQRLSSHLQPWLASLLLLATMLPTAGCLSSLLPGHKDAEFQKRVESDSFPTAAKALGTPVVGNGSRASDAN